MRVEIRLLGGFEVRVGDATVPADEWRRRNAAALVKLLALAPGRQLHREQVIDALWPETAVDDAAPRLHKAAHYARRALGAGSLVLTGANVALCPEEEVCVDAAEFQVAAEKALAGETGSALARAAAARAADAYRGDLLPHDPYEPWTQEPRERLRLLHVHLLRAAQRWEEVLAAEPADEQAHVELMRKYAAAGDRRGALRQFERMDRSLRRELGVGPSDEALALRASLLATERVAEPAPTARRIPVPVGRNGELSGLDRLLSTGGTGRECTIFVQGVAGIGKTHLLAWLAERAAARGWRTGSGVAAAVEGAWPYAPVLEAFADLCRRHPALLDGLGDAFRDEIDRALSGRELDWSGEGGHQRLFVAASELLRLAAAGAGVLLVVDDLHEADEASLRLLHYLARSGVGSRVLLVLTHRPEPVPAALAKVRDSLVGRSAALTLDLAPLDRAATAALVGRLAPSPRPEIVDEVWEASGGIPFRALELARHAGGPPSSREGTALLGGLPERTLDVLRAVAVAGATCDTDEFLALSGLAEPDAYAQLDAAIGARLLERTETGYGFRHRLVRDALLSGLPAHRERALHRDAAQRLDGLGASPARVGHHLLQAGDAAAAVPYVLRAAETEAAVGAYRDALDLVDSVRGHARGAERARLLALRADLLMAVGDGGAQAAYSAALAAIPAGELQDTSRLLRARLSRAAVLAGDLETAAAAIEGLEADGGPADPALLLAQGHLAYARGNLDAASVAAREATRRVLTVEQDWQLLDLVGLQGLVAHNRGQWFQQMRLELQRVRNRPEMAVAVFDSHLCVAEYLLYGPTPYEEVMALARELQSTAERAGVLRAAAYATALLGEAALLAGDLDVAERELQEAAAVSHDIGSIAGEALSLQRLAEVRLAQGRPDEANRLLAQALPRARWSTLASHLIQRIYGTMITAAPDPEWACAVVDRAEATLNAADFCGFCNIMLAVPAAIACADAGDLDAAHRHLADAEQSAALWEGTAWQAATLEARAHVRRGEGDTDAYRRLKAQAASLFEAAGQPLDAARCAG